MTPLEDLLQQCTVKITVPGGWGTGFFVAPGLILTCAHVVRKAADLQVTVFYPARQQPLSAIVKAKADDGKTLDLALVELSEPLPDHPCVLLDEEPVAIGQALYSYGYLESYTNAAPVRPVNEGLTGDTPPLLKLQGAQIEKGISGAALLNLKTGKVCGMVKETRAAGFDLGGGAIPTRVILEQFPELRELQRVFHGDDQQWSALLPPKQAVINFQPYLESIATTYEKWWQYYTLMDVEGKQRQAEKSSPLFDFGLMVRTVPKKERESQREEPQEKEKQEEEKQEEEKQEEEKVERFSVLEGLLTYVDRHRQVLLIGRPGAGKSTALARLLLEEATLTPNPSPNPGRGEPKRIPVLVELRYWQGSLLDLIHNAIARHDPTLKAVSLDQMLTNGLLLFDGVNELPSEEARTQLSAFRRNHPSVAMIFTTRELSLGGDLGIEHRLEMQPLTAPQMEAFIRAYIPQQAKAMLGQLKERLREFGKTPLLLWMLCSLFQQTQTIPQNLGSMFRAFTQSYEWQLKQDVVLESDRAWWQSVLQQLAWVMMQGQKPTELRVAIGRGEAVGAIVQFLKGKVPYAEDFARKCLRDLQKHHLIQAGTNPDELEFRHQLLQEYYASEALLEQLPELSDAELQREYLNYLKWTEPVALMLVLVEREAQAVRLVEQALVVDWMLGARLAGEVKREFQEQTVGMLDRLDVPVWLKVRLWGETRSDYAMSELIQLVEYPDSNVRRYVVEALAKIGVEAIPALLTLLEDSDSDVRRYVVEALAKIGVEAIPALLTLLEDSDYAVHSRAIDVLAKIGVEAIPALLTLLEDSNNHANREVIEALGEIGSAEAISALLKLLEDADNRLRPHVLEALTEISSAEVIPPKRYQTIDIGKSIVEALCENFGAENTLTSLLNLLDNHDSLVRKSMVKALGEIGSVEVIPALLKLVEDSDDRVRRSTVDALGNVTKKHADATTPHIFHLLTLICTNFNEEALQAIQVIQANCKYYNYEIFQSPPTKPQPIQPPGASVHTIHDADDYIAGDKTQGDKMAGNKTEHHFPKATDVKIFENVQTYHEPPPNDSPS